MARLHEKIRWQPCRKTQSARSELTQATFKEPEPTEEETCRGAARVRGNFLNYSFGFGFRSFLVYPYLKRQIARPPWGRRAAGFKCQRQKGKKIKGHLWQPG